MNKKLICPHVVMGLSCWNHTNQVRRAVAAKLPPAVTNPVHRRTQGGGTSDVLGPLRAGCRGPGKTNPRKGENQTVWAGDRKDRISGQEMLSRKPGSSAFVQWVGLTRNVRCVIIGAWKTQSAASKPSQSSPDANTTRSQNEGQNFMSESRLQARRATERMTSS